MEAVNRDVAFPVLSERQIEKLREFGSERSVSAGEVLFCEGDEEYDFIVILSGSVEILQTISGRERVLASHDAGRFLGEMNMLTGQRVYLTARAKTDAEILAIPPEKLREIVAVVPDLSEMIVNAFLMRRTLLMEGAAEGLRIIGSRYSADTLRLREFAARYRLPHRWLDIESDPTAERMLRRLGVSPAETPVVIWQGRDVRRNPSNEEVIELVGLNTEEADELEVVDLVVVGAGPAGLAATVYGASEGLSTVIIESVAPGGQAGTSSKIENYLGFPAGISGADLAERAMLQARKFGASVISPREAVELTSSGGLFTVHLDDGSSVTGRSVVIATGASYRKLPIPRLEQWEGAGVYYVATETEAALCGESDVVVVGAGNAAGQASVFLSDHAREVIIVNRGASLEEAMSRYLVDRIRNTKNISVMNEFEVKELIGESHLEAARIVNIESGEQQTIGCQAVFSFIGAEPHTEWLRDVLERDTYGFLQTGPALRQAIRDDPRWRSEGRNPFLFETSVPGVFAAGDVRSGATRRVASAVGEGSIAIRFVHEYLALD